MVGIDTHTRFQPRFVDRSAVWGRWELTPIRVALIYVAFGFFALFVSDVVFVEYLSEPTLSRIQAVKGGVEVLVTGGLIYVLTGVSRRQLAETNAALERRREELAVLHRVLRHNLRNDLNVIEGYAEQLEDRGDSDGERSMCDRILSECDELIRYTERAAQIRRISTGGDAPVRMDLAERIPQILADHELVDDEVSVETDLPETAPVEANRMVPRALGELLTNAVVHGGDDSPSVTVVARATTDGMTRVEVSDDGSGVPEYVARVFSDPSEDQLVHLDGLGLWFVYLSVMASGGEFEIDSGGDGTTVRLWLPGVSSDGTDGIATGRIPLLALLPGTSSAGSGPSL
ncbi:hypothetical protein BRD00_12390 [Halobacteriales archaeon QS_8_69_26]|nr:MAG: hypothetical protein BRD00_12390 [Halobacteriales archaeon QS_8_69_26]